MEMFLDVLKILGKLLFLVQGLYHMAGAYWLSKTTEEETNHYIRATFNLMIAYNLV